MKHSVKAIAIMALLVGLFAVPSAKAEEGGPNTGDVSFTLGFDVTSQYWYRGLAAENQGLIIQPWIDVTFALYETDEFAVSATVGIWNSVHSGNPTSNGIGGWFEADISAGVSVDIKSVGVVVDLTYVYLVAPSPGGIYAEEINVKISYDDSELWGDTGVPALNPYVLIAFEIDGAADTVNAGVYLELGIEPEFVVYEGDPVTITLSIPVTLGLGLDDYYQVSTTDDDGFGFVDIGVVASAPLPIPASYGSWTASLGVHVIILGDNAETIAGPTGAGVTSGESAEIYVHGGISAEY